MSHDPKPETPFCTVCLVLIALTCHTCVLVGNLDTAKTFSAIGESSGGWSDVGISLSKSLDGELDHLITWTATELTSALHTIINVEEGINDAMKKLGLATDSAAASLLSGKAVIQSAGNSSDSRPQKVSVRQPGQPELLATNGSRCTHCKDSYRDSGGHGGPSPRPATHGGHGAHTRKAAQPGAQEHARGKTADAEPPTLDGEEVQFLQLAVASGRLEPRPAASVGALGSGRRADGSVAVASEVGGPSLVASEVASQEELHHLITSEVENLKEDLHKLLAIIKPPLLQVGKWLISMGEKTQSMINEFGVVIDKVQKMIDEIMSKVASGGDANAQEQLNFDVHAIFDANNNGFISSKEFTDVASLYGITALEEDKGKALFKKYDKEGDDNLTMDEFDLLMADPSVPKVLTFVLRTYAKKLAGISGNLKAARKRDEVAHVVSNYLTLVATKNETKVKWISQAFTNGSLPVVFVADVIIELAASKDNPSAFSIIDTGAYFVKHMTSFGEQATLTVLKKLSDPAWWKESGKDPADQAKIVRRVTQYISNASKPALLQAVVDDSGITVPEAMLDMEIHELAHSVVERRARMYAMRQRAERARDAEAFLTSDTSASFCQSLLGTVTGAGKGADQDVTRVLATGETALPETLQFAHWLAENTSSVAHQFQKECFGVVKTSSNTVDSFANALQAGLKKISNFLKLLKHYATPAGINHMETMIQNFLDHALDEVLHKADLQLNSMVGTASAGLIQRKEPDIVGVWKQVTQLTQTFKSMLPTVIEDMKFARREVSLVSKTLDNIFSVFKVHGPPVFDKVSSLYKTLWIVYFVVFALLTVCLLLYGFWASGYLGGPQALNGEDTTPPPTTFKEKVSVCCRACCMCMTTSMAKCHDLTMCFWSCVLLSEVIVLLMFIIAIVLVLLAGIKVFLGIGCQQVYLLNDLHVCSGMMMQIKGWLGSFWSLMPDEIQVACSKQALVTCHMIGDKLMMSAILTGGGSLLAATVTGQLIFESARLHESAWWIRHIKENHKEDFGEDDKK